MAYVPIPTPEELKLAEAKTLAWSEGYATARVQCVAAAYAAAASLKIDQDTFARVLVHALNAPKGASNDVRATTSNESKSSDGAWAG